jgi:hypothetical protein
MGQLPKKTGLISGFCSSKQMFAFSFLQIPGHPEHPCFRLKNSGHYGSLGTWGTFSPHLLDLLHARHTKYFAALLHLISREGSKPNRSADICSETLNEVQSTGIFKLVMIKKGLVWKSLGFNRTLALNKVLSGNKTFCNFTVNLIFTN